jgi:hypothetical protein
MSDPRRVKIVYPERRWVSAEQIKTWAHDSYHNNADWYRCCRCGGNSLTEGDCAHEADCKPIYNDGRAEPITLEQCIEWLDSTGEVTFARDGVRS